MIGLEHPEWHDRAACRDMDSRLFFPERGADTSIPKAVCKPCRVRKECLQFALDNNLQEGIWGGVQWRQRRRLKVSA